MIKKIKRFYGHVELRIPNNPWWYTAEIGNLYVNEKYRNLGCSKILIKTCLQIAKELGIVNVMVAIYKNNLISQKLFTSFGFKQIITKKSKRTNKQVGIWEYYI
jgi:ribosomal protein S18 acetylase RimI-like enzyme